MKRIQFILTIVTVYLISVAQAQVPDFAPVGAKWYYSEQAFIPPPYGEFPHIVEVTGKEIYQGKLCSKLIGVGSETVPEPLYVYTQNDSVFFYSLLSNQFELLYDFGALPGESWIIGGLGSPSGPKSLVVQVDSISQIIVNSTPLTVQHISYPTLPYEWGYEIITGIGNTYFLTPDYGLYEGGPMGLRCYADSAIDLILVPYPCDTTIIITNTGETDDNSSISVYPNPTSHYINIQLGKSINQGTFRLYDAYGRLVLQTPIQANAEKILTTGLAPGFYFWEVLIGKTYPKSGRIIID